MENMEIPRMEHRMKNSEPNPMFADHRLFHYTCISIETFSSFSQLMSTKLHLMSIKSTLFVEYLDFVNNAKLSHTNRSDQ